MDRGEIRQGFEVFAGTAEKINAFIEAGFPRETLARIIGVGTPATIDRWQTGETVMRSKYFARLEPLREAMHKMVNVAEVDPEDAAIWMQSPIGDNPDNIPIDILASNPKQILGAIDRLFVQTEDGKSISRHEEEADKSKDHPRTPLKECPPQPTSSMMPKPVHEKLGRLVSESAHGGTLTSQTEVICTLIATCRFSQDELIEHIMQYRTMTAADIALENDQ